MCHVMHIGPVAARAYPPPERVAINDLLAHFGVSGTVSTRAATLLGGLGYEPVWVMRVSYAIRDPMLLTAEKRRRVALERDHWTPAAP